MTTAHPSYQPRQSLQLRAILCMAIVLALRTGPAQAHAAEQGFVLLLPTTFYITSGVAAVALSILLVAFVPGRAIARAFRPVRLIGLPNLQTAQSVTSLLSTFLVAGLVWIGIAGPTDPQENLLPLTFWTVFWVGLVVVQGVLGDVWRWINPWTGLCHLAQTGDRPLIRLPDRLGLWPAVVALIGFHWFAVVDIAPNDPGRLATAVLAYWLATFIAMIVFGAEIWLARGEVFTIFFRFLARLAPIDWGRGLRIGLPGWNCLQNGHFPLSTAVFCIALLGTGSFDGLHETFWWLARIGINPLEFPGRSAVVLPSTFGLIFGTGLLIAVFAVAVWAGVRLAGAPPDLTTAFSAFAVTLLPIALGYHFAHFLVSFLVQIQHFNIALSDPMGTGADLFGRSEGRVTVGFLATQDTVRIIWLTQAAAVVGSHILAVLMAHAVAHGLYQSDGRMRRAQIGIGVLMVAYTVFGLWLLASPRGV